MKKYILFCIAVVLLAATQAVAQESYNERVMKYVAQHYTLALSEQRTSGIPAAITLGQGILETEAGGSELMTEANNHFGIKCNSRWSGPTFSHTDDAPNECFKRYSCAAESYKDHSDHLRKNQRYSPLFKIATTDYAAWAVCLKKCGYATNPQYAQQLIKIIEDYKLQTYTYSAMDSLLGNKPAVATVGETADTALVVEQNKAQAFQPAPVAPMVVPPAATVATTTVILMSGDTVVTEQDVVINEASGEDTSQVVRVNGMKAFYAHKDEMLLGYAVKYNVRYPKLLENNDLKDAPLPYDMYVYLERKMTTGTHATHEVIKGENMLLISQSEGIQLKKLMALNLLYPNEEPAPGTILQLQKPTAKRPEANGAEVKAHSENAIVDSTAAATQDDGYIVIKHDKPAATTLEELATPLADTEKTTVVAKEPIPGSPAIAAVPERKVKQKQAEVAAEDLSGLKADLDKAVYADNSQLQQEKVPVPKATNGGAKYYTVKKGETAFSIAKRNNVTVDQLYKWNNIDASGIKTGKSIIVQE